MQHHSKYTFRINKINLARNFLLTTSLTEINIIQFSILSLFRTKFVKSMNDQNVHDQKNNNNH